nr:MAG TPA: hypothetical protein [Bacteriophage sp.]
MSRCSPAVCRYRSPCPKNLPDNRRKPPRLTAVVFNLRS